MPEIAYTEYRSVAEHTAMLKSQGFRVTENVADIRTEARRAERPWSRLRA
jgi:aminobenzoyl-glutamate utilization protein B